MRGFIQTVTGRIEPERLGLVLPHEHIIWDQLKAYYQPPDDSIPKDIAESDITLENRLEIMYYHTRNAKCLVNKDAQLAAQEISLFANAGGGTIVDVTTQGLYPDPAALVEISTRTGVNIVTASGYYTAPSYTDQMQAFLEEATESQIADSIINQFANGIDDTGVKPGVIGEIGLSSYDHPIELKVLRGAIIAQRETGAALYIHHIPDKQKIHLLLDMVESGGGRLDKVVLCHCQPPLDFTDAIDSYAKRGAYIAFDQFGMNFTKYNPVDVNLTHAVMRQIERGNTDKLLISHDMAFRFMFKKYGGFGYAYIPTHIREIFGMYGRTAEFERITRENPARLLTMYD